MGLKAIEMQVALPRSQEAGQMQEQIAKQGQRFQETLTEQQLKEEVIKRSKVNQYDNVEKKAITDEQERERQEREQQEKKRKKQQQKTKVPHPYLGSKIDYTG